MVTEPSLNSSGSFSSRLVKLRDAATIVLHHHEWYDGHGYPHGLKGQQIPIGARIVAVVDAYEAMVSGRPYRKAISHKAALEELRRNAGQQFDPEIVEQFISLFAAGMPGTPSGGGRADGTSAAGASESASRRVAGRRSA